MNGIVVLKNERGLRVGYMAYGGDRAFLFGGPPEGVLLQKPKPPTPSRAASPGTATGGTIKYSSLPIAAHHDGECPECGRYPNPTKVLFTDDGYHQVIECGRCHTLMRPRPAFSFR